MTESKKQCLLNSKLKGNLTKKGIEVTDQSSIDALKSRGYGTLEDNGFMLTFYEALYLQDKAMLETKNEKDLLVGFQELLSHYEKQNENAWVNYLVYRDLRSRGYVVREGFGVGIDFRIYERGTYGKDTAPYLIVDVQEGKPLPINELTEAFQKCKNQKKELVLAVINRRGEIVYYSVGELHI